MLFISINCFGQKNESIETCATDRLMKSMLKEKPNIKLYLDDLDIQANNFLNSNRTTLDTPITIPVVFYIVHNNEPLGTGTNISDQQVQSQITALNDHFINHNIKFCLATKTGSASIVTPYNSIQNTQGIIHTNNNSRTNHTTTEFEQTSLSNIAYGTIPSKYLRIWVVKSIDGSNSGVLGYSVFPNTSPFFDGIVMRYDTLGSIETCNNCNLLANYDKGKTLIHEVGHYLGLYHTFHESCSGMNSSTCNLEGDRVCDTPPVNQPNFNCIEGTDSCLEDDNLADDIHNFMDYGDDNCIDEFTTGQANRMHAILALERRELVSNDNLIYTGVCGSQNLITATFTANKYNICPNTIVSFQGPAVSGYTYLWNFGDPASGTNNTSTIRNPSHTFTSAISSPYIITLTVNFGTKTATKTSEIFVNECSPILNTEGNWYFSTSNGLNFSTGIPEQTTIPAANLFDESCAVQNNDLGNLLFYTNGVNIWNNNHVIINQNTPLMGNKSSKGGVIIVPSPAHPTSEYYIFTKAAQYGLDGFRYTIVTTQGTTAQMTVTTNNPINFPQGYLSGNGSLIGAEGVTAIKSCEGYWIISILAKGSNSYLTVYSLKPDLLGISNELRYVSEAVIPNMGYSSNLVPALTSVDASPDGNKLAVITISAIVEIFNFNKFTGAISHYSTLDPNLIGLQSYGGSFSPNSNLFYIDTTNGLFQYDLSYTYIKESARQINTLKGFRGDIQRGPDNKLYMNTMPGMSIINQPNSPATIENPNACYYSPNGPITARSVGYGLPNMLDAKASTVFNNSISTTSNGCYALKFIPNACEPSYFWNFGDSDSGAANSSTLTVPSHTFSNFGNYTITLKNASNTIIATKTITINPKPTSIITGSSSACIEKANRSNNTVAITEHQNVIWSIIEGSGTISGLNNQSDITINWTSLPGKISVTVTDEISGCSSTSTRIINSDCSNQNSCPTEYTFASSLPDLLQTYQASNNIEINNNYTSNEGTDITLKAGNSIVISPNAHIKNGSTFRAHIGPCTEPNTGKNSSKKSAKVNLNNVSIYPNPTSGIVNIEVSNSSITEITLNSIDGKLVHFKKTPNVNYYSLDLSSYEKGIYLLNLKTLEGEFITKKIIKQ